MKKLVLALASLALFTGSAAAADLAVKAPPMAAPAPVYNWTGFWISGGFGYALADVGTTVTAPTAPFAVFDPGHDLGMKGWLGKVGAGFDYQFTGPLGSWVIGVFADGSWSNIRGQDSFLCTACVAGGFGPGGFAAQQQNDWSWAVGARLGYVVTPTLLTYFNGGWTQSHWKQVDWLGNDPTVAGFGSFTGLVLPSQTRNGWFIGGGTEYSFANSWIPIRGLFWKNEVRFSEFGNQTNSQLCVAAGLGGGCGPAGTINSLARTHIYEQAATTELVYRFNWSGAGVVGRY
jgi:outer membrane immunogenic protein